MKQLLIAFCSVLLLVACKDEAKVQSEATVAETDKNADAKEEFKPVDSATMMQAWQTYMTPGEMHKLLASFNGTWEGEVTMWMAPGAPPQTSKSVATNRMIYNGLYQESKHKGSFGEYPFEGTSIWGYDNAKKKFFSTWIDNMGSGVMIIEGDYDPSTKTFSFAGTSTNPVDGKECNIRETLQIVDENTQIMKMYGPDMNSPDKKEYQTMEIVMKRKA